MKRYFVEIAYNGSAYCGWQVQKNKPTVQLTLNNALSTLLNQPIATLGCGRTDAGVHASSFYAHFDAPDPLPDDLLHRLNRFLPTDIAIKNIYTNVPPNAHARFDATYRAYQYHLHFNKNPFKHSFSTFFPWLPLNIELMLQAAPLLLQYSDFPMFCKTNGANQTTICQIYRSELCHDPQLQTLTYHVAANRFLRGTVRLIVGALAWVGKEKLPLSVFEEVLATKGKIPRSFSAPANGLFLSEVRYPYIVND